MVAVTKSSHPSWSKSPTATSLSFVGVKKPLSAFFHFSTALRAEVKAEYPTASFGEVGKILGEWWAECSGEERAKYDEAVGQLNLREVRHQVRNKMQTEHNGLSKETISETKALLRECQAFTKFMK